MKRRGTIEDTRPLLIVSGGHLLDPAVEVECVQEGDAGYQAPVALVERIGPAALAMGLQIVEYDESDLLEDRVEYLGSARDLETNLAEAGFAYRVRSHLFTREEHALLTVWLGVMPAEAKECFGRDLTIEQVSARYTRGESGTDLQGQVATVLLRSIEDRLPNWLAWLEEGSISGRTPKRHIDRRKLHMPGQHILTINWADSGPGFSWPMEYNLIRLPLYDRYVVTASGDSEDYFYGQADMALGSFPTRASVLSNVRKIILSDWRMQKEEGSQERWEELLEPGMVDEETAMRWRKRVWTRKPEYAL
jgi:hypothetical protein